VSLSTTAINDRHASQSNGFRSIARNSSETISGLQIHLNHGLSCLGCHVRGLSQAPFKTKSITELQEALQVILDSLPQVPINNRLLKASHYDWRVAQNWRWTIRVHKVTVKRQTNCSLLFQWRCFAVFRRKRFSGRENRQVVTLKYQ